MKKLFTLLSFIGASVAANAQAPHVFTEATGPKNHVGIDTMYGTVLSSVGPTNDAQWALWDLSNLIIASYKYYAVFTAETGFANATHGNLAYVDIAPGITYQTKLMFAVKNDGIKIYGERMTEQTFSLTSQTGNPGDKIVIEAQDVVYSAPQVQLPYPVTIGTKWNSVSNSKTNIRVTMALPAPVPSYNNAPGERRSIITSDNEVVGWGTLRVKRLDGKSSGSKPVLLVKNTLSTKDSIYVNGSPVPDLLLQQAGLTQGQTRIVYQKSFYREYEMLPMLNVTYDDATFTNREDVNVHAQRLPYPDGVETVDNEVIAQLYPNPNNGSFTIKVGAAEGKWSYSVTDMTGKTVAAGNLALNGNQQQQTVPLAGTLAPGAYIVTVQQDGVAVSGVKMNVQ